MTYNHSPSSPWFQLRPSASAFIKVLVFWLAFHDPVPSVSILTKKCRSFPMRLDLFPICITAKLKQQTSVLGEDSLAM